MNKYPSIYSNWGIHNRPVQ